MIFTSLLPGNPVAVPHLTPNILLKALNGSCSCGCLAG